MFHCEVIIVDNSDKFHLDADIKNRFSRVHLIRNSYNRGFGAACNQAIAVSSGEYLCFINSDAQFEPSCLHDLYSFLERFSHIGVSSPNVYNTDYQPTTSFGRIYPGILFELNELFLSIPSRLIYRGSYNFNFSKNEILFFGPISGSCFMARSELIKMVKGFDEEYFLYYEDTDLMYRLKCLGTRMANLPYAAIRHLESKSQVSREKTLHHTLTSKWIYLKKHQKNFRLVHLLFLTSAVIRIFLFSFVLRFGKVRYWRSLLIIEHSTFNQSQSLWK